MFKTQGQYLVTHDVRESDVALRKGAKQCGEYNDRSGAQPLFFTFVVSAAATSPSTRVLGLVAKVLTTKVKNKDLKAAATSPSTRVHELVAKVLTTHSHCLPATLVAMALAAVTIALFVAHHPRRQRHGPCPPRPLCCPPPSLPSLLPLPSLPSLLLPSPSAACSHHLSLPTIMVVWSPRRCSLASHHPPLLPLSHVDCHDYPMLPNSRDPSAEGAGGHTREPVKSASSSAGRCIHGEPTDESNCGDLMVGKAGTRMSYHSSSGVLIASRRPLLRRLAMVGCCVLC